MWKLFIFLSLFVHAAQALPTYAVKHRITQCTACHVSPSGGGIRNLNGKMYGARGFEPSVFSEQPYFAADWRALYFKSEKPMTTPEGSSIMEAIVSGDLPLNRQMPSVHLVFNQGVGGLLNDRDTYLQMQVNEGAHQGLVQYLQVGRLQIPFGIRTDEHRTYVRLASQTSWNDFVMGVGLASELFESLHYDLVFVNGESGQNPNQLSNEKSDRWGGVLNFRWTSPFEGWPLVLGLSGMKLDRSQGHASAVAFYSLYSIDRATHGRLPLEVSFEVVRSNGLNDSNVSLSRMVEAPYLASVADSASQSVYAEVDWDLNQRWVLTYKFDEMLLDYQLTGDYYRRHGAGAKYYFGPNMYLMARYELASSGQPSESDRTRVASQNAFWSVLRAGF